MSAILPAPSYALLTDLYELTMAAGYAACGMERDEAVFHLFYRRNPFRGGFVVACGLEPLVAALEALRFGEEELAYLAGLEGGDGRPLFTGSFLKSLGALRFTCDVDAVPEGTVVFPNEPLVRIKGPMLEAQIVESLVLNVINFQSLVATKAARVGLAARGEPVLEFGLRRAQGVDGALAASRAAYAGGVAATSNVLAGKLYGIPVKGTHAHSWVMSFPTEEEAFDAYARSLPNNVVLLVDTYDTLEGVKHAIAAGRKLRAAGHELQGIRLDSGDLAALSIEARRTLDEAGFPDTFIVASNDLDEGIIQSLKEQGARISVWGVGTKLVTAYDEPALGGVYKLAAYRKLGGEWEPKVKLSEQTIKTSIPGIQQVRRYHGEDGHLMGDTIFDVARPPADGAAMVDAFDPTLRKSFPPGTPHEDLLVPVLRGGARVGTLPGLPAIRERVQSQLALLPPGVKRFVNPHLYPVGLERRLHDLRTELILRGRGVEA